MKEKYQYNALPNANAIRNNIALFMLYDIWLRSINILHKIWILPIAEDKTTEDMGNISSSM